MRAGFKQRGPPSIPARSLFSFGLVSFVITTLHPRFSPSVIRRAERPLFSQARSRWRASSADIGLSLKLGQNLSTENTLFIHTTLVQRLSQLQQHPDGMPQLSQFHSLFRKQHRG